MKAHISQDHCLGALLVSMLTRLRVTEHGGQETRRVSQWRLLRTMQHSDSMSAGGFFFWYMRSWMGNYFLLHT